MGNAWAGKRLPNHLCCLLKSSLLALIRAWLLDLAPILPALGTSQHHLPSHEEALQGLSPGSRNKWMYLIWSKKSCSDRPSIGCLQQVIPCIKLQVALGPERTRSVRHKNKSRGGECGREEARKEKMQAEGPFSFADDCTNF